MGWRVAALADRVYPTLVADPASSASGHLLADLTSDEWRVLDAFEDTFYQLARLTTVNGTSAYAYADPGNGPAETRTWNPDVFVSEHLPAYRERTADWRTGYESAPRKPSAPASSKSSGL